MSDDKDSTGICSGSVPQRCYNNVNLYFKQLDEKAQAALRIANDARRKGYDFVDHVEITLAPDVAGRVEGIVGPKGISTVIRELVAQKKTRDEVAFETARRIVTNEFATGLDIEQRLGQAVRTGLAVLTEGVLVAPTEGISAVKIEKNPDGSNYLAIYFSGPIRSAGGTAAALAVLLGDYVRRLADIGDFIPTETELLRYVEEVNLYDARCARLQYKPSDEEIKWVFKNCKVCIAGEPTHDIEVSVYRNLDRMKTNRVRSGVALVSCEGIAQKSRKVLKYAKKYNLDWGWLEKLIKEKKKEDKVEIKPNDTFLDGLVAGRPIFAYPSAKGGFRLRYGRTRFTGIAAKAIHPATMVLLDYFPALGTQLKIERPGKGTVITPCDTIMGPIVRLKNGDVIHITSSDQAKLLYEDVDKILFLGDMLVSYNDFSKANHVLLPSPFVEEVWELLAAEKSAACGIQITRPRNAREAFELARSIPLPLYPSYLFFWSDISKDELLILVNAIATAGTVVFDWFDVESLTITDLSAKPVLESLGVPHKLREGAIIIEGDDAYSLLATLGMLGKNTGGKLSREAIDKALAGNDSDTCAILSKASWFEIRRKSTYYIGARMGRPEKADDRSMAGSVHGLFPIGTLGGKLRSVATAIKSNYASSLNADLVELHCRNCNSISFYPTCVSCGARIEYDLSALRHSVRPIDFKSLYEKAAQRCGCSPEGFRLIVGLTSSAKFPELLEKGLLRAKHGVYVFKDGTCRFDSTDLPATHFKPCEIGTSVEKLRSLGYLYDASGKPLESENQVVELLPQDIILSENSADFFLRMTHFIDDLLIHVYGMHPFYNAKSKDDLVGHLFITLSPHTSAGVVSRLIGFVKGRVGISHPYVICARRRNADGDEDTAMLLMDAFLNFSKHYLPETRGSTMDAPIVLTTVIDPAEVDDEVHAMEVVKSYGLDFYRAADEYKPPSAVKPELVEDRLGTERAFYSLDYTHEVTDINDSPTRSEYVLLKSMKDKLDKQFSLYSRLRAVDAVDGATRLLSSHFIPDIYGNLRSFSRQTFRCGNCNNIYRRVPLSGKCEKCSGKLLLTINKGGIEKYIKLAKYLITKYGLPEYTMQRLVQVEKEIASIFEDDTKKQASIAQFL
ncbi:MAG: DNA polymerase II large subunit [Candidatus Micrarchaeota archaeon]|nr:DNA polymerase II large subunit [Candidatus Micrarchaeota archaeon]